MTHQQTPVLRLVVVALLVATAALMGSSVARADFGFTPSSASFTLSTTQAGGHPDVTTAFQLNRKGTGFAGTSDGSLNDLEAVLPVGISGSLKDLPRCLERDLTSQSGCPISSQVGVAANTFSMGSGLFIPFKTAVYNMQPAEGQVALLGFRVLVGFVHIGVRVRSESDYGITATIRDVPQDRPVVGTSLTLWGVPADPSHDVDRYDPSAFSFGTPTNEPRRPFMLNPTTCDGPHQLKLSATSWQDPSTESVITAATPAITGCDRVPFEPSIAVHPGTTQAGAPTGLDVNVHVEQHPNADGIEASSLRDAAVTLPDGLVVSPSSASGLGGCSEEQIGLKSVGAPTCPDSSKLGTVQIDSPLLPEPLTGHIYLAQQGDRPGNGTNPFGSMLALYLHAEGQGVTVKLAGKVTPDPTTGRLTTTFLDNPQLPFTDLKLSFKGGPRAPLSNPTRCGVATTTGSFTPHSGNQASTASDSYTVTGCGDPNRFAPGFSAGVMNPQAGATTPFSLTFNRDDADQALGAISITMPPGLLAYVGSVPRCADAAAATGSCPEASRIGTATTTAGPGSQPFGVPGAAYLTEGYKGGQYGLAVVVPVVAGPLNLGTVVVRQAIYVDPHDVHLTIISDPLPTILSGIPLQIRSVTVNVDRAGFMLNPTRCTPSQVAATVVSTTGAKANVASRFQVGGCDALPLKPKLALAAGGKGEVRKDGHPSFTAVLTQQPGESGLRQVAVTLPKGLGVDLKNLQTLCTTAQANTGTCPAKTVVGKASVVTPVLDAPLTGPIFLVEGAGQGSNRLPRLWMPLRGPISLDLWANNTFDKSNRLVATFAGIPDAPITRFDLQIDGGREGILTFGGNPCAATQTATQEIDGQNGHHADAKLVVANDCALRVLAKSVSTTTAKVKVGGLGAGRVTVSGKGVRTTRKTIGMSTQVATISAKLSAAGKKAVRARKAVRVKVTFTPAGGKPKSTTTTLKAR